MSHDLRQALQDLANSGADHAGPSTLLAGRATNRVAALRRRRRVAISAATLAGMAAVGTGAAAAISYFNHDQVSTFPDRLLPSVEAPASLTGLQCGAEVGDLTASTTPLVLGNEMVLAEGDAPVVINPEAASIVPMFLTNATAADLAFTLDEGSGVFLVHDGIVVAAPVRVESAPSEVTLSPDGNEYLLNDRLSACAPATEIPAGEYQAYGSIQVTVADGAHGGTFDVVGGPWNVVVPEVDDSVAAPVTLPAANPDASFPECGAIVDALTGAPPIRLVALPTSGPLGSTLEIRAENVTIEQAEGQMERTPTLVAVRDGVVVGSYSADPAQVPFTMYSEGGAEAPVTTGTVMTTLCSDPSTPLPQGSYSIWASQDFAFTSVYGIDPARPGQSADDVKDSEAVDALTSYRALSQVATLWMDGTGHSSVASGPAPGWPAALPHEAVFGPDRAVPESVVWLAATSQSYKYGEDAALIPSRDSLVDLGYPDTDIPFACQAGVEGVGIDEADLEAGYGTAVMFASSDEAQTFVDLWEQRYGPVLGVVSGGVGSVDDWENEGRYQYLNCR